MNVENKKKISSLLNCWLKDSKNKHLLEENYNLIVITNMIELSKVRLYKDKKWEKRGKTINFYLKNESKSKFRGGRRSSRII